MTRVLVVSQFGAEDIGGAERYLAAVCQRLPSHGLHLQRLFVDGPGRSDVFSPPWRFVTAGMHPLWLKQIDQVLTAERPDVVYAHLTVPLFAELCILRAVAHGIPVCAFHHSEVTGDDHVRKALGWCYERLIGRRLLQRLSCLLVSSSAYARRSALLRSYTGELATAPPGVDAVFSDVESAPARPYVLFVGNAASASKGFASLHRAWRQLRRDGYPVELVAIGARPVKDLGGVQYQGYVSCRRQLAAWYASATVTVLPSTTESFGMVLAEALVSGCPIITTDVGSGVDLVEPGKNGYLVAPGDEKALYQALQAALLNADRLRAHVQRQRNAYAQRFDWDRTVSKTAAVLQRCVGGDE